MGSQIWLGIISLGPPSPPSLQMPCRGTYRAHSFCLRSLLCRCIGNPQCHPCRCPGSGKGCSRTGPHLPTGLETESAGAFLLAVTALVAVAFHPAPPGQPLLSEPPCLQPNWGPVGPSHAPHCVWPGARSSRLLALWPPGRRVTWECDTCFRLGVA